MSYDRIDRLGSIQWPCNDAAPEGTPIMHEQEFVRGKGKFMLTRYVPTGCASLHGHWMLPRRSSFS